MTVIETSELIGRHSGYSLLWFVAKFPELQLYELVEYDEPPLLQERCKQFSVSHLDAAMRMRQESAFSFWDCLLANFEEGNTAPRSLVQEATFHNANDRETTLPSSTIGSDFISELANQREDGACLALSSRVVAPKGIELHLPMLDFSCSISERSEELVAEAMYQLTGADCFVINSGKSYHAIGTTPLSVDDWASFLQKSLLLGPIVDSRYVAHQLLDKRCKLRLCPTSRKPSIPRIVRAPDALSA